MNAPWWDAKFRETDGDIVGWLGWKTGDEFRAGTEVLVNLLRPHLAAFVRSKTPKTLLDFGCGWGRLTPFLLGFTERYIGVDISPAMIHRAQQCLISGAQYYTAEEFLPSGGDLPGAAPDIKSVDLAVSVTVLQHCTGDDERRLAFRRLDACTPSWFFLYEQSGGGPHHFCRALSIPELEAALPRTTFRVAFSDIGGSGRPHSLFLGERK